MRVHSKGEKRKKKEKKEKEIHEAMNQRTFKPSVAATASFPSVNPENPPLQ